MEQDFKYYGKRKVMQFNVDLSVFMYHYYFIFEHNKEVIEWHVTILNDEEAGIKNRMLEIIDEIFTLQNVSLINIILSYMKKFEMENRKWFDNKKGE